MSSADLRKFISFMYITNGAENFFLAASKKSQVKANSKDLKFEIKFKLRHKRKKITLNKNYDYTATTSWLLQSHHGSCSNIIAPAVTCLPL